MSWPPSSCVSFQGEWGPLWLGPAAASGLLWPLRRGSWCWGPAGCVTPHAALLPGELAGWLLLRVPILSCLGEHLCTPWRA